MTSPEDASNRLFCFLPDNALFESLLELIERCGHRHIDAVRVGSVVDAASLSRKSTFSGAFVDSRNQEFGIKVVTELGEKLPIPIIALVEDGDEAQVIELIAAGVHEILSVGELDGCRLVSHMHRAIARLQAAHLGQGAARAGHAASSVLARLPMAVIMVDPSGKVLLANPQGEHVLAKRDGLGVDGGGVVRASKVSDSRLLADLIVKCAAGAISETEGAISLERPSQSAPLGVLVTPLGKSVGRRGAALFVSEPEAPVEIPPEVLNRLYGFSPAESRLVLMLLQGLRIEEAANQIGVSPNTARYQLKQIFRKTDTSRQAELVKLILTGPAVLNPSLPESPEKAIIRKAS